VLVRVLARVLAMAIAAKNVVFKLIFNILVPFQMSIRTMVTVAGLTSIGESGCAELNHTRECDTYLSIKPEAAQMNESVTNHSVQNFSARFLREEGIIAGVAAGVAKDFRADVTLVRVLWIVSVCLGFGFILYPILWIAMPKASDPTQGNQSRLLGVCNQVARKWGQPVGLVRLLALSLSIVSGGTAVFGYLVAYLLVGKDSSPVSTNQ
jgi:phage shock protein PspC (stress-responsive transcriptional regulator)